MTSENSSGIVRAVSWRDLCPWTVLFRVYRLSLSVQLILLAFLAVWATSLGWQAAARVILTPESQARGEVQEFLVDVSQWRESPWSLTPTASPEPHAASSIAPPQPTQNGEAVPAPVNGAPFQRSARPWAAGWHALRQTPAYALVEPFRRLFDPRTGWNPFIFYLLGGLWSLFVWSWMGGAILRAAVVRLGRDERVGCRDSLDFAQRKLLSFMGAPLLPLLAMVLLSIPMFLLGLLMKTSLGVLLTGLAWIPAAILGLVIALFALGVLFGWPLMWAAISAEGSDAFDGISRGYAYTFQRPLHYLVYTLIATLLGYLGWILVGIFCDAVVQFAMWGVGGGAGHTRLIDLQTQLAAGEAPTLVRWGTSLMASVNRAVLGIQTAYSYSFFWTASAAIYLLLRRDADQTELDDIFFAEDDSVTYGLPTLKLDEAGVPGVAEEGAVEQA